jgi:hypothetical protein
MQQRAENPAHMGVIIDNEEPQLVEIDVDHGTIFGEPGSPARHGKTVRLTGG